MKRRDYFKAVTGFVAGVYAVFVLTDKEIPSTPIDGVDYWTYVVEEGKWYNCFDDSDNFELYLDGILRTHCKRID